jgi:hypothetical protein
MTLSVSAEGFFVVAVGAYFLMVGVGRWPVPRGGIADWFDGVSRERLKLAFRPVGLGVIVVGILLLFRLL